MKRTLGLLVAVGLVATTSAMANVIRIKDLPPTWKGGPFAATIYSDATLANVVEGPFKTFCLEVSEPITFNTTYDFTLDNGAILGGVELAADATPGIDEISWGTAWLYSGFRSGSIMATTDAQLIALQQTFWYLEDEIAYGTLSDTSYYDAAVIAAGLAGIGNLFEDSQGAFNVDVINPTSVAQTSYEVPRQSLLHITKVPDGGATVLLLGISLGAITLAFRRARK